MSTFQRKVIESMLSKTVSLATFKLAMGHWAANIYWETFCNAFLGNNLVQAHLQAAKATNELNENGRFGIADPKLEGSTIVYTSNSGKTYTFEFHLINNTVTVTFPTSTSLQHYWKVNVFTVLFGLPGTQGELFTV